MIKVSEWKSEHIKLLVTGEIALFIALIAGLYWQTVSPMFELWMTSETYSHGLLIVPLSLYLIHQKIQTAYTSNLISILVGVAAILVSGLIWLSASLTSINVIEQFALVSFILGFVAIRFGLKTVYELKGPLLFLFFAIPTGDFLIPFLQQITADISLVFIRLIGIPVFSDGLYISIPQADFLVAEACSGIRFLISTFTLGVFYSLMFISSTPKRIAFILISFITPIVANGLRVFMIVFIAYYVSLDSATGFDHIVYGWIFFAFVMLLLLYFGSYFSETQTSGSNNETAKSDADSGTPQHTTAFVMPSIKVFFTLPVFLLPLIIFHLITAPQQNEPQSSVLPKNIEINWQPIFENADLASYEKIEDKFHYFSFTYFTENRNKELITFSNKLYDNEDWSIKSEQFVQSEHANNKIVIKHIKLVNIQNNVVNVLSVYEINNHFEARKIPTKLLQLKSKLLRDDLGGTAHIISAKESEASLNELKLKLLALINK